jgi:hypothetical protein
MQLSPCPIFLFWPRMGREWASVTVRGALRRVESIAATGTPFVAAGPAPLRGAC